MTERTVNPRDDLFACCALVAFVEEAEACQGWPDGKAVKWRAYQLYEAELARKNQPPSE